MHEVGSRSLLLSCATGLRTCSGPDRDRVYRPMAEARKHRSGVLQSPGWRFEARQRADGVVARRRQRTHHVLNIHLRSTFFMGSGSVAEFWSAFSRSTLGGEEQKNIQLLRPLSCSTISHHMNFSISTFVVLFVKCCAEHASGLFQFRSTFVLLCCNRVYHTLYFSCTSTQSWVSTNLL